MTHQLRVVLLFAIVLLLMRLTAANNLENNFFTQLMSDYGENDYGNHESFLDNRLLEDSTTNTPRKIAFDESATVQLEDLYNEESEEEEEVEPGSYEDMVNSQWVAVTNEGYEYEGSMADAQSLFSTAAQEMLTSSQSRNKQCDGEYTAEGDVNTVVASFSSGNASTEYLPSINEEGNAHAERVFGRDTRSKIYNPYRFPKSAMGRIDIGCTGTFIGPRHILTAGHCVFNPRSRRWYRNLNFHRAKNCDPNRGSFYKWKRAISVRGWTRKCKSKYDYALIVVYRTTPTYMSFGWWRPIPRYIININGYPGDKRGRCMWHSHCRIQRRRSKQLGYRCDTYNGMSGSAVYMWWSRTRRAITYCVHAYGGGRYNMCTRINKQRFNQLRHWIRRY